MPVVEWLACEACGAIQADDPLNVADWAGEEVRVCDECCGDYRGGDRLVCPEASP